MKLYELMLYQQEIAEQSDAETLTDHWTPSKMQSKRK